MIFYQVKCSISKVGFISKALLLAGKDCKIQYAERAWTHELEEISDNFKIGFTFGDDLTLFENRESLIQVHFETKIHWIIDRYLSE